MKKIICIILCIVLIFTLCSCGNKKIVITKNNCVQPGSFFSDKTRFILVDESECSGISPRARIYCDTVTGVLYMYVVNVYQAGITPLYNSDGTLMLYDNG